MDDDRASKTKGLLWVLAALVVGGFLAMGLAPLAHVIPRSWEQRLSQTLAVGSASKACRPSPLAEALLQRLVARVYPLNAAETAQPIEVRVVQNSDVNAFAALGGKITINTGLLNKAESAEEVAGVLAHEIEHIRHRHVMEGLLVHLFSWEGLRIIVGGGSASTGLIHALLRMDFTRAQESQADEEGLRRSQRAKVDTKGLQHFFERIKKDQPGASFLSDHPDSDARMKMAESFPSPQVRPIMTPSEWKVLKGYRCGP